MRRYSALYGPIVVGPAFLLLLLDARREGRLRLSGTAIWLLTSGLWLWLCKAIAFDWSSTDNLNELIARDGPWGWGGGGYLYLLVGLFSVNVVLLARVPARLGRSPSLAWRPWRPCRSVVLLNLGLEPEVHK